MPHFLRDFEEKFHCRLPLLFEILDNMCIVIVFRFLIVFSCFLNLEINRIFLIKSFFL